MAFGCLDSRQHSLICLLLVGGVRGLQPRVMMSSTRSLAAPKEKSALVFGWFQASAKELSFVKKLYENNGYNEVVVVPSRIRDVSRPWGWYQTHLRRHKEHRKHGHPLQREFDVIHCMSGGFLNFYLLKIAGVNATAQTLLMDSTPILPTPRALARFSRSFLTAKGYGPLVKLLPWPIHVVIVWLNFLFGAAFAQLAHFLLVETRQHKKDNNTVGPSVMNWLQRFRVNIAKLRFEPLIAETADTVFSGAKAVNFLYSKSDPFISAKEVNWCMGRASALGCQVYEHQVQYPHVATVFKRPKLPFSIIDQSYANLIPSSSSEKHTPTTTITTTTNHRESQHAPPPTSIQQKTEKISSATAH